MEWNWNLRGSRARREELLHAVRVGDDAHGTYALDVRLQLAPARGEPLLVHAERPLGGQWREREVGELEVQAFVELAELVVAARAHVAAGHMQMVHDVRLASRVARRQERVLGNGDWQDAPLVVVGRRTRRTQRTAVAGFQRVIRVLLRVDH